MQDFKDVVEEKLIKSEELEERGDELFRAIIAAVKRTGVVIGVPNG